MVNKDFEDVKVPKELVEKMDKHCKDAGFDSVSGYIVYILKQVIAKLDNESDTEYNKEEYDKEVERELKNLGYVD
ncbi:MAG: ribbon-helix-helix domain-containing protein [Candidatus Altiarchaeales archaeon]|nr:ribbon-helix-helix domain-containing protein [Candidatus Altiarchaeales archaeon]